MERSKAYKVIAKHIYVAFYPYRENSEPIIILADDAEEAKQKAKEYFSRSFVSIYELSCTHSPQVFEVKCR